MQKLEKNEEQYQGKKIKKHKKMKQKNNTGKRI